MMIYVMNFFKIIYPGYLSWSYTLYYLCYLKIGDGGLLQDTGDVDSTVKKTL